MIPRQVLLFSSILIGLAILGCQPAGLKPGSELAVQEYVQFLLASSRRPEGHGQSTFVTLPSDQISMLLEGAAWEVSDGVSIHDAQFEIRPVKIHWMEREKFGESTIETNYSADGYRVTATCRVKVADDVKPGDRPLRLHLPAIAPISEALVAFPHRVARIDKRLNGAVEVSVETTLTDDGFVTLKTLTIKNK